MFNVPSDFDVKLPIISRSNKLNQDLYQSNADFSFRKHIRLASAHLVLGYMRGTTLEHLNLSFSTIPALIKHLCFGYLIGDFPSSIFDDKLSKYNNNARDEFIQISLHLLCPGTKCPHQSSRPLLSHIIDLTQCCLDNFQINPNGQHTATFNKAYYRNCYLSFLLSLTEIISFYPTLQAMELDEKKGIDQRTIYIKADNQSADELMKKYRKYGEIKEMRIVGAVNASHKFAFITFSSCYAVERYMATYKGVEYNKLIIYLLCEVVDDFAVSLLYKLIKDNASYCAMYNVYYHSYRRNANQAIKSSAYHSFEWFIQQNKFDIIALRKLLTPLVYPRDEIMDVDVSICPLDYLLAMDEDESHLSITWLWIEKELEHILFDNDFDFDSHRTCLESVMSDIFETNNFAQNAFESLYLLTEVAKFSIVYEINDFDAFAKGVFGLLSSDKYCMIGWQIINLEMERMRTNRSYKYYAEWIGFIEENLCIMKDNIKSIMYIIKSENGNVDDAQIKLEVASKACYNIHRLNSNKLIHFEKLYANMNEKKLMKPILESLRRSQGMLMFL